MDRVDWSRLTDDLLVRIVENHIASVDDFVMFSCVCLSWYRAVRACDLAKARRRWTTSQMPWLMLTDGDQETYPDTGSPMSQVYKERYDDEFDNEPIMDEADHGVIEEDDTSAREVGLINNIGDRLCYRRRALNLRFNTKKCYNLNLPEAYGKTCWGSPYGWVVTLGLDREFHLFNPLTKTQLPLPSQMTLHLPWRRARGQTIRTFFINKVVVLKVPDDCGNDSILVAVIYQFNGCIAVSRPRDTAWTLLHWPTSDDVYKVVEDVLHCEKIRSLLMTNAYADVFCCDLSDVGLGHPIVLKSYIEPPNHLKLKLKRFGGFYAYLAEFGGAILIVRRKVSTRHDFYFYKTDEFEVYKLDLENKCWQVVQNLGDLALFVGYNVTMAIRAQGVGCKSNCIYFCDDIGENNDRTENKLGGHDMGVFFINDPTIQPFYQPFNDGRDSLSSYFCPFWFSPAI